MRRRNKSSKIVTIFALGICILFLGIGFAAFSNTLTVASSATINPNSSTFNIAFSTASDSVIEGTINATGSGVGSSANLTGTTISDIVLDFKEPGETVSYQFYVVNDGKYDAYLNTITIGTKTCTAKPGTTQSYVTEACEGIDVNVKYGLSASADSGTTYFSTSATTTGINNNKVNAGKYIVILLEFSYASNSKEADGDFTVEFGDIIFQYSTAD